MSTSSPNGLCASLFRRRNGELMSKFDGIPGPAPKFPLGNALDLLRQPVYVAMLDYARRYGNLVVFWTLGKPNLLVNEPHLINQVLLEERQLFYKASPVAALLPIVRSSLFIANVPEWKLKRVQHPFSVDWLQDFFKGVLPTLREEARRGLGALGTAGGTGDLYDALSRLAFALFSLGNFGFKFDDHRYDQYIKIMDVGARRLKISLPTIDPFFWHARNDWFAFFEKLIAERQQNPNPEALDLMSSLLRHGTELPAGRMRDEFSTNLMAGSNPVATSLTSALVSLTRNPEVVEQLRSEIRDLGPDYELEALLSAKYLDQVVNEVLRIYSTVPVFARAIVPDSKVEFDGHAIPDQASIFISSWALHQTAEFWPEPERFDPSRFEQDPKPGTFIPFGWGPRECVGKPWALFCIKLLLVAIFSEWDVEVEDPEAYATQFWTGLFIPKGRVKARVHKTD